MISDQNRAFWADSFLGFSMRFVASAFTWLQNTSSVISFIWSCKTMEVHIHFSCLSICVKGFQWCILAGVRMGFGQKVWKARNAKLGGRCTRIVKGRVEGMVFCRGGFFEFEGRKWCIPMLFGSFFPNTHTPLPLKYISLQIYTDLKNGPGRWEKVWRFCPLTR